MKNILFLISILLFINTSTLAEEAGSQISVVSPVNEAVFISDDLKVIPKVNNEANPSQHTTINVIYPQIEGAHLSLAAQKFNKLMMDKVMNEVAQFKKYVLADHAHMQALPEEVRKNTFNIDYDIDVIKPGKSDIISIRLAIEGFQAGRAHPYHKHEVINFDLTQGELVSFTKLFKSKSNYLTVIANYVKSTLNEKIEDKTMIADGTKPLFKNYQNWNLESDSILFTFDEYQVAPYVYGTQEVEVPYEVLKKVIAPTSVIYPCVVRPDSCALVKTAD